jgi:hypothetical protein
LVLARRGVVRGLRVFGGPGVPAAVSLTIEDGAGADVTMPWLLVWAAIALVTVVPALAHDVPFDADRPQLIFTLSG